MKPVAIILILFSVIHCTPAPAQNHWADSVKAVLPAQKDTARMWSLIALCSIYGFTEPDIGYQYGLDALKLAEQLDYDPGRLYSIINMNNALFTMGNYSQELENAFKLVPLSKRMDDINAKGFSLGSVGDSYLNLGEFGLALPYFKQVLQIGIDAQLPELHRMYSGLVPVYVGLHEYDSALWYAEKGYEIFKLSPYYNSHDLNQAWSETGVFLSLGQAWEAKLNYDTALVCYRKSVQSNLEGMTKYHLLMTWLNMAGVFKKQNNFDSAVVYAQKILQEKNRSIYPNGKQKAADLLASIYQQQHQKDSSLKYLNLSILLKDSLYNNAKMMAFQNIRLKENEKQHALSVATTALQNRYRIYFLFTGLLIIIITIIMSLRNQRQKQLQKIRNTIAHDLHDEVGSALSSINIMSELAKEKSPQSIPLLESIGENSTMIQENMSDIVWAVNPKNDHFYSMVQRMQVFATEILDAKGIALSFNSDPALDKVHLNMQQRKNFYLLFKEAVNNAAKHSGAAQVTVNIARKDRSIELTVMDNGKGFDASANYNGNGLNSLQKRAKELKASLLMDSKRDKGTALTLKFKTA